MSTRDRIDNLIISAVRLLEPKLQRCLQPGVSALLKLSFHIQDGHLCHIKESDEDRHQPNPSKFSTSQGLGERVEKILVQCGKSLRQKLETSLASGWHGAIVLALDIEGGDCKMVTCGTERTHKVQSERVPV